MMYALVLKIRLSILLIATGLSGYAQSGLVARWKLEGDATNVPCQRLTLHLAQFSGHIHIRQTAVLGGNVNFTAPRS